MKHAYLIKAHHEPQVLSTLLALIDDARNDVFLHIDAKSAEMLETFRHYAPKHAGFVLLDPQSEHWGDISQMEVELRLFEAAHKHGTYTYFHLLSGVDLPIKSQDAIHRFFDDHSGKEFVHFWQHERDTTRRVKRYYLFTRHLKDKGTVMHAVTAPIRNLYLTLQKITGYRRPDSGYVFKKGSNWVSITPQFCAYLLHERERITRRMRHTLAPDEIFLHTVLWNSPFRANIFSLSDDIPQASARLIDWRRGAPYVFTEHDAEELKTSDAMFARKFNNNHHLLKSVMNICNTEESKYNE